MIEKLAYGMGMRGIQTEAEDLKGEIIELEANPRHDNHVARQRDCTLGLA